MFSQFFHGFLINTLIGITLISFVLVDASEDADKVVVRASVTSCSGCSLNRLPGVKDFIYQDIPLFHNVEFIRKPGEPPLLHFINAKDEQIETIDLSPLNRDDCNELLLQRGFYKKDQESDPVPDDYKHAPLFPQYDVKEEL